LRPACEEICRRGFKDVEIQSTFANEEELAQFDPHFLVSLGGDGTILEATVLIQSKDIPIFGINMGRLGFLANVAKKQHYSPP
jgi:NAD+ kinase